MNSVLKGSSFVLIHAPDILVRYGTTQTTERIVNPTSEYLTRLPDHLRGFDDAVAYPPNQVFIGGITPADLAASRAAGQDIPPRDSDRFGPFGEIMPQDEFILLVQASDVFDLVRLEKNFVADVSARLRKHPLIDDELIARVGEGVEQAEVDQAIDSQSAGIYHNGKPVGYVKKAHDIDENLSAHIILENLVSKASCVLSLLHLTRVAGVDKAAVDLVLDCSEEACGDMNQRGGGNMAKAAAEIAGYSGATGADVRAFCAAPAHAMIHAAALVASGTYDNVVVAAGGSVAKLGMNGKDHVRKNLPVIEDVLGGFAALVSRNDGVSPEILSGFTGKHSVGSGSSPQAVITALVTDPLDKMGLKISDIDKYSVEMQNPDITRPAGAGDVPLANYKMIAALAVKRGELERSGIADFVKEHGMEGWAPTQGHIPSGVPYLGFARDDIMSGSIARSMIIGKGSLFLGRMTNLFDGVSFILQKNSGDAEHASDVTEDTIIELADALETGSYGSARIVLTGPGSEHGEENMIRGAAMAAARGLRVTYIGSLTCEGIRTIHADNDNQARSIMEAMLNSGQADAAVTMHYTFPIGVSTVGRVVTPGFGRAMYIASTTGTSSANRVEGMVKNALYGIITAKACGIKNPKVGILNVDGARRTEMALKELRMNGYGITLAESARGDGGAVMRGNDLLAGTCDVLVTDSLTGNILVKMLSSFTTGGGYESLGWGYGPGIGEGYDKLVLILSRASGEPQVANAIQYADELVRGGLKDVAESEFSAAKKANLTGVLQKLSERAMPVATVAVTVEPPKEVVTAEISGIEITDIEDAAAALRQEGIYAQSGMGCTGPVIMVNEKRLKQAESVLAAKGFIEHIE